MFDSIISLFSSRKSSKVLLDDMLNVIEDRVGKGHPGATDTLKVLGTLLKKNTSITIQARQTVDVLIERTENKWARRGKSELPGEAVKIIGELSRRYNIRKGKQFIQNLHDASQKGKHNGYITDDYFWQCVDVEYSHINKHKK